ncbi:helix-turn-helix domain-containing protein [Providencia rettgeri]|uniref:AraC family transcriptional regulator n=1 Tax=Providencia stuartii TaxID=588 RepID=A0AAI9D8B3_PROST|nr:AraC family transcriptional regulator [Providencia stuartii]MDV5224364.1 helix-turn-helix domain-containing protein [Providencia rettgeri]
MVNGLSQQYSIPNKVSIGASTLDKMLLVPLTPSYVSVLICKSGCAVFNINFMTYAVKKNDIIVLYDDTYVMLNRRSRLAQFDIITLEKAFATDVAFKLPNSLFAFFNQSPVLQVALAEQIVLQQWMSLFVYLIQQKGEFTELMLCQHVQNFFLLIAEKIPTTLLQQKMQRSRKEQLCWRFWNMITEYCREQRDVQFYAQKLSITPFYLSQITRNFFNDAPKALIDRQVVLEIKALLGTGKLSIKEIAATLNFEDTSYLCRYFKRHTGLTLSAFKKHIAQV